MLLLVYPASTLQNISLSLAGPPPFGLLTCSLSTLRRVTLPGRRRAACVSGRPRAALTCLAPAAAKL